MISSELFDTVERFRRQDAPTRPLTEAEQRRLLERGNFWDPDASVLAGTEFNVDTIVGNHFRGRVVLTGLVFHSTLADVELSPGAVIESCPLIRRCLIGSSTTVTNSTIDCSEPTSYGIGTLAKAGLETAGRELPLWDEMTLDTAQEAVGQAEMIRLVAELAGAIRWDRSIVGSHVVVKNGRGIDRAFLGDGSVFDGVDRFVDSAALGTEDNPVLLGTAAQVTSSLLQAGVEVRSGAQVVRSVMIEASGAERYALVTESLIGPNTVVGQAEVSASFVGPFVGIHHQSLLIAAWWPEGRGNVGSGASLGSNHTSRAPDQEFRPGEGSFFGLACSVKFPCNWEDAPYSLLASGVSAPPQRLSLPFSLVTDDLDDLPATRGLNRVIPGWVLSENIYALVRNESKYLSRNRARRHRFDLRIIRPDLVDKVWKARDQLVSITGKPVYTKRDLEAIGRNYLLEDDRVAGITTYETFLRYATLKIFAEAEAGLFQVDQTWLRTQWKQWDWTHLSREERLRLYFAEEDRISREALRSRQRDYRRGGEILPDYTKVHGLAEDDPFLRQRATALESFQKKFLKSGESAS